MSVPLFDLLVAARDRPAPRERRLRRSAAGRFSAGRLDGTLGGDGVEVHPEGEGGSLGFGEVGEGHGQLRGGGGRWWFTRCLIQETIIRSFKGSRTHLQTSWEVFKRNRVIVM